MRQMIINLVSSVELVSPSFMLLNVKQLFPQRQEARGWLRLVMVACFHPNAAMQAQSLGSFRTVTCLFIYLFIYFVVNFFYLFTRIKKFVDFACIPIYGIIQTFCRFIPHRMTSKYF